MKINEIIFCCDDFKFRFDIGVIDIKFRYIGKDITVVAELKGTRIYYCPFCGKKIEIEVKGEKVKI